MSFRIQRLFKQQQHQATIYDNISDKPRFGSIRWMPFFHVKKKAFWCYSLNTFEMASKKNEYSTGLLSLIIQYFLNGDSYAVIAKRVLIPSPTIQSVVKKYNKTNCILNLSGRGRKRKTKNSVDRIIQRKLQVDHRKAAPKVKIEIEKELSVFVHSSTIRNRLHEIGLHGRVARKKPYVNKINEGKRIVHANVMMEKLFGYWKHIFWSDESHNGGLCDVTQGDRSYTGQIKDLIAKLISLKYDLLMACLGRDIQISKHKQFRSGNEMK